MRIDKKEKKRKICKNYQKILYTILKEINSNNKQRINRMRKFIKIKEILIESQKLIKFLMTIKNRSLIPLQNLTKFL